MGLKILHSGLLTTIQDTGRIGYQKEGILVSGAMDTFAIRVGNILVGNPENAAAIETTFLGPKIRFEEAGLIAITGADLSPTINGEQVKMWRPLLVSAGCTLEFGTPRSGSWSYIAVSGSFKIPQVLGSYATYLRADFGGFKGKPLHVGDIIPVHGPSEIGAKLSQKLKLSLGTKAWCGVNWTPDPALLPVISPDPTIKVLKGPEYEWFARPSAEKFWQEKFIVTSDSDRMGYQLRGPELSVTDKTEIISSAVSFGTIQVPPDGHPIVLLADHQTTGGYPRIGQVCSAHFSSFVQVPMGKKITFQEATLPEAQSLYYQQERNILHIKRALHLKIIS
ncbi:biotin-dependent carboxyltransferase family protein [Adhaeribacter aquaticus]|uniref:5-oxoprolinase subunit C family protein n=1 Tax=Adhaeribacter aquaticus TaxID=299567 RepID=UPI0004250E57|nr:biotin-dependent carboxyltransferase family protein [Adhaeribacter aquaticus]